MFNKKYRIEVPLTEKELDALSGKLYQAMFEENADSELVDACMAVINDIRRINDTHNRRTRRNV